MAMSAVSFSDVSLMAIVPERECRMPTLIGPLSSVAGAAAATGAAGAALAGAAVAGAGAGGESPLLQAKNAPARPLSIANVKRFCMGLPLLPLVVIASAERDSRGPHGRSDYPSGCFQ